MKVLILHMPCYIDHEVLAGFSRRFVTVGLLPHTWVCEHGRLDVYVDWDLDPSGGDPAGLEFGCACLGASWAAAVVVRSMRDAPAAMKVINDALKGGGH